uniref:G2/mitotic-specific cyclin-1 n=1 Tax=Cajanus cajan TaxID=3821 RepID=A0A151TVV2_CAJCA|nr:G2/mitotic-specific cyclin-1 [Cajanus cajan]
MLKTPPSMKVAATIYITRCINYGFKQWSKICERHSKYSENQLLGYSSLMVDFEYQAGWLTQGNLLGYTGSVAHLNLAILQNVNQQVFFYTGETTVAASRPCVATSINRKLLITNRKLATKLVLEALLGLYAVEWQKETVIKRFCDYFGSDARLVPGLTR